MHLPWPSCCDNCRPVCLQLVGGPGTAKTCTIQQFLGRFNKDEFSTKTITFSYLTTPLIFQRSVEVGRACELDRAPPPQARHTGSPAGRPLNA